MANIQENSLHISKEEKNGVTQELVKSLFDYKDGRLYWKIKTGPTVKVGNISGYINNRGLRGCRYLIKMKGGVFIGARIIFLWHHGYLPEIVDHIDRDALNDKIENLRGAIREQNSRNRTSAKGSTSQYLGVSKDDNRWVVNISINKKQTFLGSFDDEKEAALAYDEVAFKHFGEFANLNIKSR